MNSNLPCSEALLQNYNNNRNFLEVDLEDLKAINSRLHDEVLKHPNEYIPAVRLVYRMTRRRRSPLARSNSIGGLTLQYHTVVPRCLLQMETGVRDALDTLVNEAARNGMDLPYIQVLFTGELIPTHIRDISAQDVNKLLLVPGIVINATRTRPKATVVRLRCSKCGGERDLVSATGFGNITLPRTCNNLTGTEENGGNPPPADAKCPLDPYIILTDKCTYMDSQSLKLQEAPEQVPTGEMPRHLSLSVERSLADKVSPGTRISAIGVVSVMAGGGGRGAGSGSSGRGGAVALRTPYLRVVGIMVHEEGSGRSLTDFTPEQEAQMRALAKEPGIYQVREIDMRT